MDRQALFEKISQLVSDCTHRSTWKRNPIEHVVWPYQMVAEWIALRHELKQQEAVTDEPKYFTAGVSARYRPRTSTTAAKVNQKVAQADQKAFMDLVLDASTKPAPTGKSNWRTCPSPLQLNLKLRFQPSGNDGYRCQSQPDGTVPTASTSLRDVLRATSKELI